MTEKQIYVPYRSLKEANHTTRFATLFPRNPSPSLASDL